ncbi:hypothetical protein BJX65DRAFT_283237 [Aspergillus insuetus]
MHLGMIRSRRSRSANRGTLNNQIEQHPLLHACAETTSCTESIRSRPSSQHEE